MCSPFDGLRANGTTLFRATNVVHFMVSPAFDKLRLSGEIIRSW